MLSRMRGGISGISSWMSEGCAVLDGDSVSEGDAAPDCEAGPDGHAAADGCAVPDGCAAPDGGAPEVCATAAADAVDCPGSEAGIAASPGRRVLEPATAGDDAGSSAAVTGGGAASA